MAEPTLIEVFGTNATQTSSTITITKADLPGLTASANNKAESLLAAIVLKAQATLTQTAYDADLDRSIYIEPGFPTLPNKGPNNAPYRVDQLTINLAKPDTSATLDPDDY